MVQVRGPLAWLKGTDCVEVTFSNDTLKLEMDLQDAEMLRNALTETLVQRKKMNKG